MKLTLSINDRPISKKNSKRVFKRGSKTFVLSSKAYLAFEESALWQLKAHKARFKGKVTIDYEFRMKGKLDTDVDNMIAGINDILEKSGIIDNDKNVVAGSFAKYPGFKDWQTVITIIKLGVKKKG